MRPGPWLAVEPFRVAGEYGWRAGMFQIPLAGNSLRVIASEGMPAGRMAWEHVSVSLPNRCPRWQEMCYVKSLFWLPEEAVMQLHPPASDYVNNHPHCLHLWRPVSGDIPLPPREMV